MSKLIDACINFVLRQSSHVYRLCDKFSMLTKVYSEIHAYFLSGLVMFNENVFYLVFCSKQHVFICLINLKVVCFFMFFFLLKFNSNN